MTAFLALLNIDHAGYALDMFYQHSVLGTLLSAENSYTHRNNLPKDPSFTIFLVFVVLNLISVKKNYDSIAILIHQLSSRSAECSCCLLISRLTTPGSQLSPAVTALVADLKNQGPDKRRLVTATLCSMCLVGLPFQLGTALLYKDDRDYHSIELRYFEKTSALQTTYIRITPPTTR